MNVVNRDVHDRRILVAMCTGYWLLFLVSVPINTFFAHGVAWFLTFIFGFCGFLSTLGIFPAAHDRNTDLREVATYQPYAKRFAKQYDREQKTIQLEQELDTK